MMSSSTLLFSQTSNSSPACSATLLSALVTGTQSRWTSGRRSDCSRHETRATSNPFWFRIPRSFQSTSGSSFLPIGERNSIVRYPYFVSMAHVCSIHGKKLTKLVMMIQTLKKRPRRLSSLSLQGKKRQRYKEPRKPLSLSKPPLWRRCLIVKLMPLRMSSWYHYSALTRSTIQLPRHRTRTAPWK